MFLGVDIGATFTDPVLLDEDVGEYLVPGLRRPNS